MQDSKTLFCSSQFPLARKGNSSKFADNLGTPFTKVSSALHSLNVKLSLSAP